jgi:hypothetical protein
MHLASFRKGWESERLAEFLLSRLAFVASPTTIADDVGSDFYCTLFETTEVDTHQYLQPRLAVTVQVKSAGKNTIDLTDKVGYFNNLELPYLLGIVDRATTTLRLYSGCYLPLVYSQHGQPSTLYAVIADALRGILPSPADIPAPTAVPFPLVVTLHPSDSETVLADARRRLIAHCSAAGTHVRSRLANDYLFRFDDSEIVFAGPSSAQTFRGRLLGRLAETLRNLDWLSQNNAPAPDSERQAVLHLIRELGLRHALPATLRHHLKS